VDLASKAPEKVEHDDRALSVQLQARQRQLGRQQEILHYREWAVVKGILAMKNRSGYHGLGFEA
jgi:hypothetical protein